MIPFPFQFRITVFFSIRLFCRVMRFENAFGDSKVFLVPALSPTSLRSPAIKASITVVQPLEFGGTDGSQCMAFGQSVELMSSEGTQR